MSLNYEESVCVPRDLTVSKREKMCSQSGLFLTVVGRMPAEGWGYLTWALIGVGALVCCVCTCSCYYNFKI